MAVLTREQVQGALQQSSDPNGVLRAIPEGRAGIAATMDFMVELTRQYRTDLTIRTVAENIVSGVQGKNFYGEAAAIQAWVRDNIRYTMDVDGVETVKNPVLTLYSHSGDCDDMSLLAGALLNSIGHPVRYVAVGTQDAGNLEHVYVETKIGTRWVGVETTEDVELGWTPQPQLARMVRNV